jgi:hypothetical protein
VWARADFDFVVFDALVGLASTFNLAIVCVHVCLYDVDIYVPITAVGPFLHSKYFLEFNFAILYRIR